MKLTHYEQIIVEATGCKPEDAPKIENIMRDEIFHSTLDWQTKEQLADAAKEGAKLLKLYRAAGLED